MKLITLSLAMLIGLGAQAQTKWQFDKAHTEIQFIAEYMVFSDVTGEFKDFDMSVSMNGTDLTTATIEFTAKSASIFTDDEKRDGHLKSPDFFDVENHPTVSFKSKKITKTKEGHYTMIGDMTMRGVTKELTVDVRHRGTSKDPWGNNKAGFSIRGNLNRYDYGLKWNAALEAGGVLVGEEIELVCNVTLIEAK